jgi:hypothetical protein
MVVFQGRSSVIPHPLFAACSRATAAIVHATNNMAQYHYHRRSSQGRTEVKGASEAIDKSTALTRRAENGEGRRRAAAERPPRKQPLLPQPFRRIHSAEQGLHGRLDAPGTLGE